MGEEERVGEASKLEGVVLNPASMVGYQEGAVVSREVVRGKTGTVTIFAFDAGQGLSEHTAPFNALVYVLEGEAAVSIEDKTHQVGQGSMIILPAGRPHSLFAPSAFKMMLVMIRS